MTVCPGVSWTAYRGSRGSRARGDHRGAGVGVPGSRREYRESGSGGCCRRDRRRRPAGWLAARRGGRGGHGGRPVAGELHRAGLQRQLPGWARAAQAACLPGVLGAGLDAERHRAGRRRLPESAVQGARAEAGHLVADHRAIRGKHRPPDVRHVRARRELRGHVDAAEVGYPHATGHRGRQRGEALQDQGHLRRAGGHRRAVAHLLRSRLEPGVRRKLREDAELAACQRVLRLAQRRLRERQLPAVH